MNEFLKLYIRKQFIMAVIQDKFTLTKFSLCIQFHKELRIFVFVIVYLP